jgi:hypothetical protein
MKQEPIIARVAQHSPALMNITILPTVVNIIRIYSLTLQLQSVLMKTLIIDPPKGTAMLVTHIIKVRAFMD